MNRTKSMYWDTTSTANATVLKKHNSNHLQTSVVVGMTVIATILIIIAARMLGRRCRRFKSLMFV